MDHRLGVPDTATRRRNLGKLRRGSGRGGMKIAREAGQIFSRTRKKQGDLPPRAFSPCRARRGLARNGSVTPLPRGNRVFSGP